MGSISGYNSVFGALLVILFHTCAWTLANEQPEMEKAELHINVSFGRSAILPCMINMMDPDGAYQVVWMNPRKQTISYGITPVTSDRRFTILRPYPSDWNLQITGVRQGDSGRYVCSVNTRPVQKKSVYLNIQVPPRISISPNMAITEGRNLQLYCNVTGQPTPTITWFRNDEVLQGFHDELLLIKNITREKAGIYKCLAINNVDPEAERDVSVDVKYAPSVSASTTRIGQLLKKEVILECRVVENPQGTIVWRKGNKEIRRSNWRYQIEIFNSGKYERSMTLRIRSVEKRDFGKYVCQALNAVGRDDVTIQLYELTTPSPVTVLPTTTSSVVTSQRTKSTTSASTTNLSAVTATQRRTTTNNVIGDKGAYGSDKGKENVIVVITDPSPSNTSSTCTVHIGNVLLFMIGFHVTLGHVM